MGANKTRRAVRSAVLAARAGEYAGWVLIVACAPCSRRCTLPMGGLPPDAVIGDVVRRLRCERCHAPASMVAVDNTLPGWRAALVQLWGAGSYG